jgi:hypothetical protein
MEDSRLRSLQEKILLCYIWGFQINQNPCYVSSRVLTSITDLTDLDLTILINSLKERRILKETSRYDNLLEINVDESGEEFSDVDIYAGL